MQKGKSPDVGGAAVKGAAVPPPKNAKQGANLNNGKGVISKQAPKASLKKIIGSVKAANLFKSVAKGKGVGVGIAKQEPIPNGAPAFPNGVDSPSSRSSGSDVFALPSPPQPPPKKGGQPKQPAQAAELAQVASRKSQEFASNFLTGPSKPQTFDISDKEVGLIGDNDKVPTSLQAFEKRIETLERQLQENSRVEKEELENRFIRAELELKATRAEMELRAARAEMEVRAVRAELEARALRAEFEACRKPQPCSDPDLGGGVRGFWDSCNDWGDPGCWDSFGADPWRSPEPKKSPPALIKPHVILGRYEVHPLDILGQGGFSTVRRGQDIQTGEIVAVKTYSDMENIDANDPYYAWNLDFFVEKFKHEVEIFRQLHEKQDMHGKVLEQKKRQTENQRDQRMSWFVPAGLGDEDCQLMNVFGSFPESSELFVRLIDYSKDRHGDPAPDSDGVCYVVLELAEYTLDQLIRLRKSIHHPFSQEEVFQIFRQLAQVIAGLHAKQFVHADLKPLNVMYFPSGCWKLIDMDGMVCSGDSTDKVCYTPMYTSPEFAASCVGKRHNLDASRHLDVWSLAMTVAELITFEPMLTEQWHDLDSCDDFLDWLADERIPIELPPEIKAHDLKLADLLGRMLEKNTSLRASMVEVLVHPFFTGHQQGEVAIEEKKKLHLEQEALQLASLYVRSLTYALVERLDQQQKQPDIIMGGSGHRDSMDISGYGMNTSMYARPSLFPPTMMSSTMNPFGGVHNLHHANQLCTWDEEDEYDYFDSFQMQHNTRW